MKVSIFIVFLIYIGNCNILAQTGNNWCLGKYGGVNFNTNPPSPFLSAICDTNIGQVSSNNNTTLDPVTVSDCAGNLWFYSTGITVWNKYHKVMPNGMLGVNKSGNTTFSMAIPKPNDDSAFYLVLNPMNQFFYTLINMRLDSGRGDVSFYPLSIDDSVGYTTLTGIYIKHANDSDYWLILKPNPYVFKSYLVTKDSISRIPIVSNGYTKGLGNRNRMRATRDGKNILVPNNLLSSNYGLLQMYKFDNKTGKLSKPVDLVKRVWLQNRFDEVIYPELSANDSLVYYATSDKTTGNAANKDKTFICQLQRFASNPDKTIKYIDTLNTGPGSYILAGIKLGPDNKLYYVQDSSRFNVLNYPDKIGTACKAQHNVLDLYPGKNGFNMPCMDFPIKRINNKFDVVGANGCGYDTVRFTADADSAFKSYTWYFGDGDSAVGKSVLHQYKNAGSYYVKLGCELGNCGYMQWVGDSVTIKFKPNIALTDTTYYTCGQYHVQTKVLYKYCDTINLHLGNYDTTLYTKNASTVNTFIYNSTFYTNGTYIYYAAAKNKDCYDSVGLQHIINIEQKPTPYFTPNYLKSCGNSTITLTDSSGGMDSIIQQRKWTIYYPNNTIIQYDTASTNKLKLIVQDTGYYNAKLVYVTKQGCIDSLYKTNVFRILPQPVVYIDSPSHNPLCFGDSFILTAKQKDINYPPLVKYKWNAGQVNTPSIKVDTSNSYYVATVNTFGCGAQSNTVKISFLPQLFANIKTAKDSLYIIASRPIVSYTWYKDSILYNTTSSLLHPPTGRYYVHVVDANGCVASSGSLLHTGINHIDHIDNFIRVYPNPANDVLYIEGLPNGKTSILMYDMLGRLVLPLVGDGSTSLTTTQKQFSIGHLPKGLYILSVGSEKVKVVIE